MTDLTEFYNALFSYLCPAGDGVYAVSSGQEYRQVLQNKLYGSDKQTAWQQQLKQLSSTKTPLLLGIPSDCGGGIQRGANWGPLYVREALYTILKTSAVLDLGDVRVIPQLLLDDYLNQATINKCRKALYGDSKIKRAVSPLSITHDIVKNIYQQFPNIRLFGIGGDHSVSFPLIKEYLQTKKSRGIPVAVIHFDAHTDLLKQRLGIDISFGSWTYHILSDLPSSQHLIQIGIRASGHEKKYWQETLGVQQVWAKEIKQLGMAAISQQIANKLTELQVEEVYVTFDIDCLDSIYAGATGTPEPEGLNIDEVRQFLDVIARYATISGADLMEVAPFVRTQLTQQHEPATTLHNAALIASHLIGHLS